MRAKRARFVGFSKVQFNILVFPVSIFRVCLKGV